MTYRRDFLPERRLDTVYIGGGTPSLLPPEQLQGLLDHASGLWDCSELKETTVEANPEDLTDDYLAHLARTNIDRLSIGIQSFDDELLKIMNRRHNAARAKQAVEAARRHGFDNISIDLIFGLPGMTRAQWEHSLDEAIALGVQHISAYHLTIEPGTVLGKMARDGRISPVAEIESERQYDLLRRKLADAGFEHYEISNFALPGRRAAHNSAYWSGAPYLGIGASAHSFDGERRREWVAPDIEKYMAEAGTDKIYGGETLTDTDLFNEHVMTSLRTAKGLDLDAAENLFGTQRIDRLLARAKKFLADGLLVRNGNGSGNGNCLSIPPAEFLLSDYVIGSLFEE